MDDVGHAAGDQHGHLHRPGECFHSRKVHSGLYGLSPVEVGQIFSAFVFGYALFQIPSGWLADRVGPRRLLTFAILWWSLFTAVTALAGTLFTVRLLGVLGSFIFIRFLIGAGAAAAYPNFNSNVRGYRTGSNYTGPNFFGAKMKGLILLEI